MLNEPMRRWEVERTPEFKAYRAAFDAYHHRSCEIVMCGQCTCDLWVLDEYMTRAALEMC